MADYISKFTGQQIDAAIQKATDIAKTATDINSNLAYTEGLKTNLNTIADNEIVSKKSDGSLQGTGIVNEDNKIFFPKDGRFPSGSIDIGPAATLSENGGWLQYNANTLDKDYILLDYENDETGSKRPVYWERAAEEKGHVVNNVDSTAINNITTFNHIPTANSQVNALYLNFATDVSNFMAEIVSLNTGKPIKYIPNENAWKTNVGGLNLASGVRNILQNISPISLLTAYNLKINFKANNPINLKGDGTKPYLMVDRQLITAKPIALQGEGGGGSGSSTLLGLTDIPDSYVGKAGYLVRIKNSEDGIEFDQPPDFALPDLSNVSSSDLKKSTVKAGMLQQDLEDVQLPKLKEKVEAAGANLISVGELHGDYHEGDVKEINFHNGLDVTIDSQNKIASISLFKDAFASTDLTNVKTGDLDTAIRLTNAYKQIAQKHSDTPTPSIIETGLKYLEETSSIVDWSSYSSFKFMYIAYQFDTDNQTISQILPKVSENKAIIISNVGLGENPLLTLTPSQGDSLHGTATSLSLTEKGINGVLISEPSSNNWMWIPYPVMHDNGISVSDDKNNIHIGMQELEFKGATLTTDPNDNKKSIITVDNTTGSNVTFVDSMTNTEFTASKIQSIDKSVRISNLKGVADFSKGIGDHNEGIHVCLGNDELLNSKYGKSKLYFSDTRVKGGMFVYTDNDTKSFVIQDVDPQDDPNISGGTTFIIALYYEPNPDEENIITQDGQIAIELVDDNDVPINDTQGNPMGAIIDYKANDKVKPELYIGECQATAFTRVHLKIDLRFANEEIISVGANTQLCIQSITKDESSGLALLSFMAFTGYQIAFDTKYYGYNSLNMAQFLNFDFPETNTNAEQMYFGNNTYLDFKNNSKISIVNNHLIIKDDGTNLPVWSIVKVYNEIDSKSISGKNYKVTATLTDKDDAYRVTLLEYTGALPAPIPTVLRYVNENPVFTDGWVQRDSMFISEDAISGDHTQSQTFTIPDNAKGIAIIMYHVESQIPVNLSLKDLEGDITPWFNRVVITDNSHITEKYLQARDSIYRSIVKTPSGYSVYRYTVNSTDTKIPVGIISGNDDKIQNDNSWHDAGSIDPNKVQGDFKFLVDGKVTMSYTARCFNEQGSLNQIQFWLAKVNGDGTFSEVANSKTASTIEAQRTQPKMVSSFKFSFDVKANETYRMFAKSNKDDGFYIQSNSDGVPLFRTDIEFDEITADEKALTNRINSIEESANEVRFMDNGKEVYNKMLEYDITTGKMKVIDKQ